MEGGIMALAGFGFMLGIRHALDADHITTISTLVSEHKSVRKAAMLGVAWGIGHSIALMTAGVLVLALKLTIPAAIEAWLEFLIGALLVFLGARAIWNALKEKLHSHSHGHEGKKHAHFHYHDKHVHTLGIGMIHGLAGSAAVMLLVLATTQSVWEGVIYIAVFGTGTIMGMLIISVLIGLPFAASTGKARTFSGALKILVGAASIVLGIMILNENLRMIRP